MSADRVTFQLALITTPLKERCDALLTTLEELGFEINATRGQDVYVAPSPEGLQLLRSRRDAVNEALRAFDDILQTYPEIPDIAVPKLDAASTQPN